MSGTWEYYSAALFAAFPAADFALLTLLFLHDVNLWVGWTIFYALIAVFAYIESRLKVRYCADERGVEICKPFRKYYFAYKDILTVKAETYMTGHTHNRGGSNGTLYECRMTIVTEKKVYRFIEPLGTVLAEDAIASPEEVRRRLTENELSRLAEHIVVLNDLEKEEDDADMESIFLLLNLRDIRARYGLRFNITAEMRAERNQNLVAGGDRTDFVVASSMSSLCLAQLAESPELLGVFRELLSNEGCELFLKSAAQLGLAGAHTAGALRTQALAEGYILLGCIRGGESVFNPPLHSEITLDASDMLIVLGEK